MLPHPRPPVAPLPAQRGCGSRTLLPALRRCPPQERAATRGQRRGLVLSTDLHRGRPAALPGGGRSAHGERQGSPAGGPARLRRRPPRPAWPPPPPFPPPAAAPRQRAGAVAAGAAAASGGARSMAPAGRLCAALLCGALSLCSLRAAPRQPDSLYLWIDGRQARVLLGKRGRSAPPPPPPAPGRRREPCAAAGALPGGAAAHRAPLPFAGFEEDVLIVSEGKMAPFTHDFRKAQQRMPAIPVGIHAMNFTWQATGRVGAETGPRTSGGGRLRKPRQVPRLCGS